MGYVPPSYVELPLPTIKEFNKNPEYYMHKLGVYKKTPFPIEHLGLERLWKWLRGGNHGL